MPSNPKTDSAKKELRRERKRRKVEAFLNLVRKDEAPHAPKRSRESFASSFNALKDEIKKYQVKQIIEPTFHLTDIGYNALVKFSSTDKSIECSNTLFFEDIYHLLMKSLLGHLSPYDLKWAELERPQHITKVVVFEVEGLSTHDIIEINSELSEKCKIFQYVFKIVSSKCPFATELSTFHMSYGFYNYAENNSCPLFPIDDTNSKNKTAKNAISKLHLLLSPIQLAMENFPLPASVFPPSKSLNYVHTKGKYKPVTADSPMFAVDCEMCLTCTGASEVTRVAIVDENLKTIYHTLVKPINKITNYMTKYSGVTEKMLQNVTTTLNDVHEDIQRILPPDAILCGQSLNCDLHALKMIHPYVIDTSVIFNLHGVRNRKTSLKNLAKVFLDEIIQNNKGGHHPVEDSIATMKLVQLKLEKGIKFGDAVFSPESSVTDPCITVTPEDNQSGSSIPQTKFSNFVKLNSGAECCGFFDRIRKFSKKNVCLIGNKDALDNYCLENPNDRICKKTKSCNKKVIKSTIKNLNEFNLLISHMTLKDEFTSVVDIVNRLKEAYESFPNRALFLLITKDNESHSETFNYSYCMAALKNAKENQ